MTTKTNIMPAVILATAIMLLAFILLFKQTPNAQGSTARGSEYQGTTTTQGTWLADGQLQSVGGTLGSVVVTGSQAGTINIYDATTSSILLRAANLSTSSILLATLPANAATSTYTFDRSFYYGLLVNIVGTVPTTTITYRQ